MAQAYIMANNDLMSQMESPIEVVRRFCAGWSENLGAAELAAFFAADAVYRNIPLAPVTGREAIANNIASFIRPGAPGVEGIEFRVINIAANGPVVMTERVDVFRLHDRSFELQVMGSFEVSLGKINAWRDYFDMSQFTSRMDNERATFTVDSHRRPSPRAETWSSWARGTPETNASPHFLLALKVRLIKGRLCKVFSTGLDLGRGEAKRQWTPSSAFALRWMRPERGSSSSVTIRANFSGPSA